MDKLLAWFTPSSFRLSPAQSTQGGVRKYAPAVPASECRFTMVQILPTMHIKNDDCLKNDDCRCETGLLGAGRRRAMPRPATRVNRSHGSSARAKQLPLLIA